jgi:hypothetical protein
MQYWLALHSAQGPPFGPWYPASHTHQLAMVDFCGLFELLAQGTQKLALTAPDVVLYVLTVQFRHVPADDAPIPVE